MKVTGVESRRKMEGVLGKTETTKAQNMWGAKSEALMLRS